MDMRRRLLIAGAAVTFALMLAGLIISLAGDKEGSAPSAPIIPDEAWRVLIDRAERCAPRAQERVKLTREKNSPQIKAVHIHTTSQFVSIFPSYQPERATTAMYYGPAGFQGITYHTAVDKDSAGMDYARDAAESQQRRTHARTLAAELLNELDCAS